MAAVDYFLKIEGIDGESLDSKHKSEIEISSFSWGMSQSGTGGHGGGGGGAGKVSYQDLHFTAHSNKATPKLFLACAAGWDIKKATLTCRKAGGSGKPEEYLVINLGSCFVSEFDPAGISNATPKVDDRPIDSFSLSFQKMEWIYDSPIDGTITQASFDFTQPGTTP